MPRRSDATLTATRDERGAPARLAPCLVRVLSCGTPASAPVALSLADLAEVVVGRGPDGASVDGARATLAIDDAWMSSRHATFERRLAWSVVDAGSKNGVIVNGTRRDRWVLNDGDVVELGRTFFLFRAEVEAGEERLHAPSRVLPELATLVPGLAARLDALARTAVTDVPVVLLGESGVGKEIAARAVHAISRRRGELVAVNCGALAEALVQGELFGHRRGAFSGAVEDRPGLVRAADGGTLFLDEIADLGPGAQAALLRVLQEREVTPLGGTRAITVDVRLVAATHRDLDALVSEGAFRKDLHARLGGFRINLPPLRERREDLGLLVAALLARLAPDRAAKVSLHPQLARALFLHPFTGNVRELERCLSAALALSGDEPITLEHTPTWFRKGLDGTARILDEDEQELRERLAALLREHKGNVAAVARAMGKARMQIQRWMKRFGLERDT